MIWPYLVLAYLSLIVYGLSDNIRGPLFPELLQRFEVSNTTGSWFYAIASIFSFIGSWLCLQTLKKFDRVQNLYGALLVLLLGLLVMGFSQNFYQLLIGAAFLGLGLGQTTVIFNLLATLGSSLKYRKQVVSGLHSMYALSSFLAPLVVAGVYGLGGQWAQCFFFAAGLCGVLILGGFISYRRTHPQASEHIMGLSKSAEESLHPLASGTPKGLFIIAIAFGFYVVAEILMGSRLALYLRFEKGFDLEKSSFLLTGFFLGLLISRIIFSLRPLRFSVRKQLIASLLLATVFLFLGLYFHEGFFILAGASMGPFYALSVIFISEAFPQYLNQAMALAMSIQSLMVVIMHLSSGWAADRYGLSAAMLAAPFCMIAAVILLGVFPQGKKQKW